MTTTATYGSRTEADRFWAKVTKTDGCWEWTGKCYWTGYGRFSGSRANGARRHWTAHRWAWSEINGAIPHTILILHRCDNRKCVRPSHLFTGTHADNTHDMIEKGRGFTPRFRGEKHPLAKLSSVAVLDIRRRAKNGERPYLIGQDIGLSAAAISHIVRRHSWKHLPEEET